MLVQARNQANRECLYAWYPEPVTNSSPIPPRDIYILNGIDKTLLVERSTNTEETLKSDSKERFAYTAETIDEALRTPWALDYEIKRRPATPNLPSAPPSASKLETQEKNSNVEQMTTMAPRRLKSAPVQRSPSIVTEVLSIPEPRFVITSETVPVRVASAKARLNTTVVTSNPRKTIVVREVKSAQGVRTHDQSKLSQEEIAQIFQRVYGDQAERTSPPAPTAQVEIIYRDLPVPESSSAPPVQIYRRSSSSNTDFATTHSNRKIDPKTVEISAIPLNPHYIHRPGVIAIRNGEKNGVVRSHSASRRTEKSHPSQRRRAHSKRHEPLRATSSFVPKRRLSLEIDGVKLTYDPKLTLNDRSNNMTKYFLDGRLYLIKDARYNVLDNIDPSTIEKYNRTVSFATRSKSNGSLPVEMISRASIRGNQPETYLYKTAAGYPRAYAMYDHLNIHKMPLSQRPNAGTNQKNN